MPSDLGASGKFEIGADKLSNQTESTYLQLLSSRLQLWSWRCSGPSPAEALRLRLQVRNPANRLGVSLRRAMVRP
jgi:hypothetical protein